MDMVTSLLTLVCWFAVCLWAQDTHRRVREIQQVNQAHVNLIASMIKSITDEDDQNWNKL